MLLCRTMLRSLAAAFPVIPIGILTDTSAGAAVRSAQGSRMFAQHDLHPLEKPGCAQKPVSEYNGRGQHLHAGKVQAMVEISRS